MQKNQAIAQIFHDAWHNKDVASLDLPDYILEKMIAAGLCTPDSVLDAEGVRKTYENLGRIKNFDYANYRKRRWKKESMVFDFKGLEQEEVDGEILEAEQEKMFVGDFDETRQEPVEF